MGNIQCSPSTNVTPYMRKRTSIIWTIPSHDFSRLVRRSATIADVLRGIGLPTTGALYKIVWRRIYEDAIDYSHIPQGVGSNKGRRFNRVKKPLEEILVKDSRYSNCNLKHRLIEERLLENVCSECGCKAVWQNKPLSLQLDHRNGDSTDNRLSNLRLLCPNCHTQTPTFGARNHKYKKPQYKCNQCSAAITKHSKHRLCTSCSHLSSRKFNRPEHASLLADVGEIGYCATARKHGVSDNCIRKWLKS